MSSYLKVCGEGRIKKVVAEEVTYHNPIVSQWEQGQGVETAFLVLRKGSAKSNNKVCLGFCISEDCEDSEKNRINSVCVCLHWGAEREREKEMFRNWLMQVVESGRFTSSGHTLRLETQGRVGVTAQA